MAETRVPEKVVLPLTHTIFMARDTPPLGEIREISVSPALMDIQKDEAEVCCHGELAVDVAYHSKEGKGELHHAQISVPMEETLPDNWAGVNLDTSHVTTENLSWQVLTTHALELVGTLVLTPAESKQRESVFETIAPAREELVQPPDAMHLNYSKPKVSSTVLSEAAILQELSADDPGLAFAETVAQAPVARQSELMAELDELPLEEEPAGKREEVLREVGAELADDIMDGDLAHLEGAAAVSVGSEAVLETENTINYSLEEPTPLSTAGVYPYAVTESVGNEYRLKFFLPKKVEAVSAKPVFATIPVQQQPADELESELFADIPEEHV